MITPSRAMRLAQLAQAIADGPLSWLPVGFALIDADLRFVAVNHTLATINGVAPQDHLGRRVKDVLPEIDPVTMAHLENVLRSGQPLRGSEVSFAVPASPGELRWWIESFEPVVDEEGAVAGVLAAVTEITERKRAEQREQRATAFLHHALDRMPVGVVLVDADGGEVYRNGALGRIWRSERNAAPVGANTFAPMFRQSGERYGVEELPIMRSLRSGVTVTGEVMRIKRSDGSDGWVSVSSSPVDDEQGTRLGVAMAIDDITERLEAEASRDAFLGVLSHELRSPLSVILGNAELLLGRPDMSSERRLETTQDIAGEANRLARSVDDLMVLSRVDRGVDLRRDDPVHVLRVVRRVLAEEERHWPGQAYTVTALPRLPLAAGDETYLAHVLTNLLSNAAKYGNGGAIEVRVDGDDERIFVRVLDDGPGFAAGDEQRIFDLFFRSPHTARRVSGAGVGLFVVRSLVQAQGGSVWATNRPEGGAEVCVSLLRYQEG